MSKSKDIKNKDIDETIVFDQDEIKSGKFKLKVDFYPIPESEFETLIGLGTGLKGWIGRLFLIIFGSLIVLIAKYIDFQIKYSNADDKNKILLEIESYEYIAIGITLAFILIFFLVSTIYKNKKDKLISKIKKHFNPK